MLALTSRNHLAVESTLEALQKRGLDFSASAPWQELESFPPWPGARALIYKKGVCFGRGEDKGRILLALFEKFSSRPRSLVFADDSRKNAQAVAAAMEKAGIPAYVFRYNAMDALFKEQAEPQALAAARVQLKLFAREGRLLSNKEALALSKTAPVSVEDAQAMLFGKP